MGSQPYLPLYTGDWLKDPCLSFCAPATRGVWIDLLCAMHELGREGELRGTTEQIARLARCQPAELVAALTDLINNRTATIDSRNNTWVIVCRRMKKAAGISQVRREAGSKNGTKPKQTLDIDIGVEDSFKLRIGNLFKRRVTTPWSDKELKALASLRDVQEADLLAIEAYYGERITPEKDIRRRDMLTLLHNWNGEVDRARARPKPKPRFVKVSPRATAEVPEDPVKREAFLKRLSDWKANGRPLGEEVMTK
jgi:hypothetical protein